MQQFKGTGVALVTPFNTDLSLDLKGLANVVEHSIEGGVEYLVVLGTTAESATLTKGEKQEVIDQVIQVNSGRVPLVLGVGSNNTQEVVNEVKNRDLKNFEAILSVSPYYNRPTQAGIYAHFEAVSQNSKLPIILYNVPGRTGSNMLPETILKIAQHNPNIIGVKEAAGDMVQMLRILKDKPDDFLVLSGDDMLALPTVFAGGDGVISVIGQGLPEDFSSMIRDGLDAQTERAFQKHYNLMPIIDLIFAEGNPAGIKALLANQDLCKATVRLPLMQATPQLNEQIATYLQTI